MKILFYSLVLGFSFFSQAGYYTTLKSQNDYKTTVKRFLKILKKKKLTTFKVIDHQKNAKKVKMKLNPMKVIIFGNPLIGTTLMKENAEMGLELPLKLLIREDENKQVFLRYYSPKYFKRVHKISNKKILAKMTKALKGLSTFAATNDKPVKNR